MQMIRSKVGNKHKGHQSSRHGAYYENYRAKYQSKLIRRRAKRQRGIEKAKGKIKKEHPSDLRRRERRAHLQWDKKP
jgi:hypothetical protein